MTMAISKKLEIIYHNGQPDGIRSIRRNLSTMTTYVIPRPLLSEAKNISGISRPGIYYLINEDDRNFKTLIVNNETPLVESVLSLPEGLFYNIKVPCSI